MRALRNLAIFLVVLLALGAAADVGLRLLLANRVEAEIEGADRQIDVSGVEAEVGSFPFLPGLVLGGEVNHLSLRLDDLVTPGVTFDEFEIDVEGLTFDRSVLFNAQVQVQDLDRAVIRAEISEANASEAVGVPVTFTPEGVSVQVAGQARPATVALAGGELTLAAQGVGELVVPISEGEYFPCTPEAQVRQAKVVLRCTADSLPAVLRPYVGGGGAGIG